MKFYKETKSIRTFSGEVTSSFTGNLYIVPSGRYAKLTFINFEGGFSDANSYIAINGLRVVSGTGVLFTYFKYPVNTSQFFTNLIGSKKVALFDKEITLIEGDVVYCDSVSNAKYTVKEYKKP